MGNTIKSKDAYDVDYASVPLTNDSDDEDRFNKYIQERGQVTFRKTTYSPRGRCCGPKLRTTALVCVGTFVVIGIVIASMSYNESTESNLSEQQQTKFGWSKTFNVKGGEAPVRLLDIDGDGIQDILVAMSVDPAVITKEDMDFCSKSGSGPTCNGEMYALRGYDGKLLWTKKTRSDILFMNCIDFDINMDHHADCVVTGRNGLLETVDVKTGKLLWDGSQTLNNDFWGVYHVARLPDIDKDGVPEMLIANGGNSRIPPDVHERQPGRLMLLSGKTGQAVGTRHFNMPNNRETYMSPIVYKTKDGSLYILFGSGGETVSGDFMMISLPDLYTYITEGNNVVHFEGAYDQWPQYLSVKHKVTNIYTLYNGQQKGVSVPPVIVDVNNDGYNDILMTAFEGRMILFSGRDLSTIWSNTFPGMETYTSPAPGYFNDDNVLDFMVHWSVGAWSTYSATKVYILNGKDGSSLWSINANQFVMPSDITVRTSEPHRDLFIFRTKGRGSTVTKDGSENIHGIERLDQKPHQYFVEIDNVYRQCLMNNPNRGKHNNTAPPPGAFQNIQD